MKSLIKLLGKLGQGTLSGLQKMSNSNMNQNWMKMKAIHENYMTSRNLHKLNLNGLHVRNGSRGEGMGMSHQMKNNRTK